MSRLLAWIASWFSPPPAPQIATQSPKSKEFYRAGEFYVVRIDFWFIVMRDGEDLPYDEFAMASSAVRATRELNDLIGRKHNAL